MNQEIIIQLIESYFKDEEICNITLGCISRREDVIALAEDIGKEIDKAHKTGYDYGAQEAASDILNKI